MDHWDDADYWRLLAEQTDLACTRKAIPKNDVLILGELKGLNNLRNSRFEDLTGMTKAQVMYEPNDDHMDSHSTMETSIASEDEDMSSTDSEDEDAIAAVGDENVAGDKISPLIRL